MLNGKEIPGLDDDEQHDVQQDDNEQTVMQQDDDEQHGVQQDQQKMRRKHKTTCKHNQRQDKEM